MNSYMGISAELLPTHDSDGRIRAKVLGTLQVCRGNEVLDASQLGGPRARQILEILLLHLGTPVSKSRLIDMLWNGSAPAAAVSTLESYVSVLRSRLQPGEGRHGVLKTTNGGYLLEPEMIDLDLTRFDSLLQQAERAEPTLAYALFRNALPMADQPLLGSELLPEWAADVRYLHEARVNSARLLAGQTALVLGHNIEATVLAQRVLLTDSLNEPAWTCLIMGLERSGNPLQGLRAFNDCRQIMDRELGCRPSAALLGIQERLLRQTSTENADFGEVVAALLAIRRTLEGADKWDDTKDVQAMAGPTVSLQAAGAVISGYLERAIHGALY